MNAITKLTAAALGALSIAGGVAVAQSASSTNDNDGRAQTANYGTPPGAPLKRDGSLSADPKPAAAANGTATDMSTTSTTTTSTTTSDNASTAAPAAAPMTDNSSNTSSTADAAPQPRADRN